MADSYPFVSIIVPARNEEKFIAESILSLTNQDYPADSFEIIVVNDNSNDRTVEIVKQLMRNHGHIKLYSNTSKGIATARNLAIANSKGEIVLNYSAHASARRDLIRTLVLKLLSARDNVVGVGCRHEGAHNNGFTARACGAAIRSWFGAFGTTYNQPDREEIRDSIAYTAYEKGIFSLVGGFDTNVSGNEDRELNFRIKKAGYCLLFTPSTIVYHHEPQSLVSFFAKMIHCGRARARTVAKHRGSFKIVYAIPSTSIILLTGLVFGSFFNQMLFYVTVGLIAVYVSLCLLSAGSLHTPNQIRLRTIVPWIYPLIHVGYGVGFMIGMVFNILGRSHRGLGTVLTANTKLNKITIDRPAPEMPRSYPISDAAATLS